MTQLEAWRGCGLRADEWGGASCGRTWVCVVGRGGWAL